ncbi:IS200/IS605 family element transposase accessory protein TnpB [Tolypothrix campylonemoides VB511288]|nr:IS200/IS605 family element transposase accessory protein TnpB [Tolypothrix campylonemoides VB511288]
MLEQSLLLKGKMKSQNQPYNKEVATIKHPRSQGFWSVRSARITSKRNRQMQDTLNEPARLVMDYCLEHNIKAQVFGWDTTVKQNSNLATKTNQRFMQLLTARLKNHIKQLCEYYGMQLVEIEEAYISQASFLNTHPLSKYGETKYSEKPNSLVFKDKRVKRGMFRTTAGTIIDANANNRVNTLTKLELQLGANLAKPCKALLIVPPRLHVWETKVKKRRDMTEAAPVQTA